MKLSNFIYDLPEALLAEKPSNEREECRLMVLDRSNKSISHHTFKDIINFFDEGDLRFLDWIGDRKSVV